jgi:hypothetical protein
MDQRKKNYAISILRRASYRWPGRYKALSAGKIGRNQYICKECGPDKVYGKKDIQLDHIEPVVPVTGWEGFDSYIDRMFVDEVGYQVLCRDHHLKKSKNENEQRKDNKKVKKKVKKK